MEDENGIELSLALSCGGSAGKLKGKDGSSSDIKAEEGGNGTKSMGDFRSFLHAGIQKQGLDNVSQSSNSVEPRDVFFTDLAKSNLDTDTSTDLQGSTHPQYTRYCKPWVGNGNKSVEVEEGKSDFLEVGGKLLSGVENKRKFLFEERSHSKKHEREIQNANSQGKNSPMGIITSVRTPPISVPREDGSTAENEVVAESETPGSASRLVSHHEDRTKQYAGGGHSDHGFTDLRVRDIQGQKWSNLPPGNESKGWSSTHGIPFSLQPLNVMTMPSVPLKASGYPPASVMHLMPAANFEQRGSSGNLQLAFGYPPAKLPTLETDLSWATVSHPQQFPSSHNGRSIDNSTPNLDKSEDGLKISQAVIQPPPHSSSGPSPYNGKTTELAKGNGKQHIGEEVGLSSSSQTEDEAKGNGSIFWPKEASNTPVVESFPNETSAIRPGIAPGVKFGGCGSYPDLPWVSTTAPGPNGRTISGVTYKYNEDQIRIVCACHSSHMSPEEFILHATSDVATNPEGNAGLATFPNNNNPAASAQS